jgi:hypothetical protein
MGDLVQRMGDSIMEQVTGRDRSLLGGVVTAADADSASIFDMARHILGNPYEEPGAGGADDSVEDRPLGPDGDPRGPDGNPRGPDGNPRGPDGNPYGAGGKAHDTGRDGADPGAALDRDAEDLVVGAADGGDQEEDRPPRGTTPPFPA